MAREAHSHAFGLHHPEKATLMYWQALPPALSRLAVWQQMGRHPDSYKPATGSPGLVAAQVEKAIAGSANSKRERFFIMMKRLFWREAPPDRKEEGEYSNRRLVGGISVRINLLK